MNSVKKTNVFDNLLINPYLEFFNNIIYTNIKKEKKTEHFVHDIFIEWSIKELKKLNNKYLSLLKNIDKFSLTEQEAERALNTLIFLQRYFYDLKNKIKNHSHPTEKQKKLHF